MMKKRVIATSVIVFAIIYILLFGGKYESTIEIDVVSTMTMNNEERLCVVANRNKIYDKEALANEILHKYIENTFKSMKFSSDLNKKIMCVKVDVYLCKSQTKEEKPLMKIEYKMKDTKEKWGICEKPEYVDTYIDGYKVDI